MKSEKQFITYEELLKLDPSECVGVNRVYFFFLYAKSHSLKTEKIILQTFSKYLEIESMEEKLFLNSKIKGYYLVETNDIKRLIDFIKQLPWLDSLIKTNIKKEELEQIHNNVKQQYLDKHKCVDFEEKLKR